MKTITYDELIDRIRQKKPPKRITVCVEGRGKAYAWDRKCDNYFDNWGNPLHCFYSLAELAIASIEIYEMTNAEKFKEVFGVEPQEAGFLLGHVPALGLAREWWDEPYKGDK